MDVKHASAKSAHISSLEPFLATFGPGPSRHHGKIARARLVSPESVMGEIGSRRHVGYGDMPFADRDCAQANDSASKLAETGFVSRLDISQVVGSADESKQGGDKKKSVSHARLPYVALVYPIYCCPIDGAWLVFWR